MDYQSGVMDCYERMAPITGRMLALARAGDWDAMAVLQEEFQSCVERLKTLAPAHVPDQSQLAQKQLLLERILANDAEIRDLATPQFARLSALMDNLRLQQNLHRAYVKAEFLR